MKLSNTLKLNLGVSVAIISLLVLGLGTITLGGAASVIKPDIGAAAALQEESAQGVANVIKGIVRWAYILFFILAVLFILVAAFRYLTAAGDQEKVNKAKDALIYAAVAIAIALVAISMSNIINTFLGGPLT